MVWNLIRSCGVVIEFNPRTVNRKGKREQRLNIWYGTSVCVEQAKFQFNSDKKPQAIMLLLQF